MAFTLETLDGRIAERASASASQSYTASLVDAGPAKCAQKLGEEAVETVIAALAEDENALVKESADLLYHWLVLLRSKGVPLQKVMAELEARTAQSGFEEKASRAES